MESQKELCSCCLELNLTHWNTYSRCGDATNTYAVSLFKEMCKAEIVVQFSRHQQRALETFFSTFVSVLLKRKLHEYNFITN